MQRFPNEHSPGNRSLDAKGMGFRPLLGSDPISPFVYGWSGSFRISAVSPDSTHLPPYMTIMRLHLDAEAMSWVIISSDELHLSETSRSRMPSLADSSMPLVGSSAMTREGSTDMHMAIIALWDIPPERRCG